MKNFTVARLSPHLVLLALVATPCLALAQGVPGNVKVLLVDGNLIIRGDAGDNDIILIESGVAGRGGTRVNGQRRTFIPDGVINDVRIDMQEGNDFVRVELPGTNFAIPHDLVINTGTGNDTIELLQVRVPNDTRISTGEGNDIIFIDGVRRFSEFFSSDFGGRFEVRAGSGEDLLEFHNATFRGEVDVILGSGTDGACSTQDSEFLMPHQVSFDGSGPAGFPGDGFVSPGFGFAALLNFEFYPDDCSYLGGRF